MFTGCLLLTGLLKLAAQQPYSQSPEYRGMLDELHRPAPSPTYLATGRRITADPALKATIVQERARQTVARTASLELELAGDTILLRNLANKAEWRIALDGQSAWSRGTGLTWQSSTAQVQLMNERLVRVSLVGAQGRTRLTVTAAEPFFGMGERFDSANQAGRNVLIKQEDTPLRHGPIRGHQLRFALRHFPVRLCR
jgi:hypothetical protein